MIFVLLVFFIFVAYAYYSFNWSEAIGMVIDCKSYSSGVYPHNSYKITVRFVLDSGETYYAYSSGYRVKPDLGCSKLVCYKISSPDKNYISD